MALGSDGVLTVETTGRLEPGEGLTIVAEIPAGALDQPSGADNLRYFLRDHREWIIGIFGLLAVLAYYLWAWNRVGRDPKGGAIIPLFHPPENVSAALASYIRNWGFGANAWKAFTASALSLAVRGLLVFNQEGKDLVLERTASPADNVRDQLSLGEKTLLDWVEKEGGRAEISKANGKDVARIGEAFKKSVKAESGGRHFKRNILHVAMGLALSLLVALAIVFFGQLAEDDLAILFGMFFVGIVLSVFLVPVMVSMLQRPSWKTFLSLTFAGFFILVMILNFAGDFIPETDTLRGIASALADHSFAFALALVFPLLNGLFYYLLRAPTLEGRPLMDQIEGFRMYLDTAESGRLNIGGAPEITTERFEALLPYAVALDVEKPWADAFAESLARAHPGDPDPMSHYQARWRRGGNWSSSNFGRSIASSVASATSAATSSLPRSSSGSSGFSGGSGGGGGGRGGGGW